MFKKKAKKKTSKSSPQDVTVINKGTVIEGEVKVSGTIRVYGQLNGTVRSEGKVVVAEDGVVSGDLYAHEAVVSGTVEGVIEAHRLDLRSTATVEGNVIVKKFTTETGAIFIGDCKMPQNGTLPSGNRASAEAEPSPEAADAQDEPTDEEPRDEPLEDDEAADPALEPSGDGTAAEPVAVDEPQAEPVAAASGGSVEDVKPLPNKPAEEPNGEEASTDEEEEAASAEAGGRPRFW